MGHPDCCRSLETHIPEAAHMGHPATLLVSLETHVPKVHTVWMMTGAQERQLMNATDMLLDARRTNTPIADLPVDVRPADVCAYAAGVDVV